MSLVSFDSTLLNLKKCDKVKRTQNCLKRSSKVVDFATNGKPMYDFLLNNSNSGPISHCFRDTTTYGGGRKFFATIYVATATPLQSHIIFLSPVLFYTIPILRIFNSENFYPMSQKVSTFILSVTVKS